MFYIYLQYIICKHFLPLYGLSFTFFPAIPLLGICPPPNKNPEITLSKRDLCFYVHCSILHESQDMETI